MEKIKTPIKRYSKSVMAHNWLNDNFAAIFGEERFLPLIAKEIQHMYLQAMRNKSANWFELPDELYISESTFRRVLDEMVNAELIIRVIYHRGWFQRITYRERLSDDAASAKLVVIKKHSRRR